MNLANYSGLYPVSRTLRFRLIPEGKTLENFEKNGIKENDELRSEYYERVKKLMDDYHKQFIDKVLSAFSFPTETLNAYAELVTSPVNENTKEQKESTEAFLREAISTAFTEDDIYQYLFTKDMIKTILPETVTDEEDKAALKMFSDFTTYFRGYYQIRENMYAASPISSSVAYRVINQNLPKYLNNIKIWNEFASNLEASTVALLNKKYENDKQISIDMCFDLSSYSEFITQSGIDKYNCVIGGYSVDEFTKIKGINELINEYNQKNNTRIPLLQPLYKQILSDRTSLSFLPEKFNSDNEVLHAIKDFYLNGEGGNGVKTSLDNLKKLFSEIQDYDQNRINVSNKSLTDVSLVVCGFWNSINEAISIQYDETAKPKKKTEKYYKTKKADLDKVESYSLEYINDVMRHYGAKSVDSGNRIANVILENISEIENLYINALPLLEEEYPENRKLSKDNKAINTIKNLLDSIISLNQKIGWITSSGSTDTLFYSILDPAKDSLSSVVALHNKTRNYITQKPYSKEKLKITFNSSTLMDGWSQSKEAQSLSVMLRKDNNYYLGIIDKDNKKIFEGLTEVKENYYEKMVYKLLPDPSKMLPHVCFSKKGIETFNPSEEILKIYKSGTYKTGASFSLDDCHKLINYYKASIASYGDWSDFGFDFSDTSSYRNIGEFFTEVKQQGYKVKFQKIDKNYIDQLVDEGKLYLFRIYNQDMSDAHHGKKNLHTIYFENLFTEENLKNVVYQLNGGCEMFYRKASLSINDTAVHPANVPMRNKNPLNPKKERVLHYDVIKNKRYTESQFYFHVPVTMNFKAKGNIRLNSLINADIQESKNINIVGVKRGERNLLYVSVIDQDGKIIEQKTLNIIDNHDYYELLKQRENERMESRKNWTSIDGIKDLKTGYLSKAVREVIDLALKYNAVIGMEHYDSATKNSMVKVEKAVYQQFEKAIIDKLTYYVDKNVDANQPSGALNALQLVNPFESFSKIGIQNGILFNISSWFTTNIDPTTGFVDLLHPRFNNIEDAKKFISNIDDIRYSKEQNLFEFEIDYDKFEKGKSSYRKKWTVCTYGDRVRRYKINSKPVDEIVSPTSLLLNLFIEYNINYKDDIKEQIMQIKDKRFFETFMSVLRLTLQMRNSIEGTEIDYVISPVKNAEGSFFKSNVNSKAMELPVDVDANDAYHISLKTLWVVDQIKNSENTAKEKIELSNAEWLKYAQSRH